jgi:hypothetical protein
MAPRNRDREGPKTSKDRRGRAWFSSTFTRGFGRDNLCRKYVGAIRALVERECLVASFPPPLLCSFLLLCRFLSATTAHRSRSPDVGGFAGADGSSRGGAGRGGGRGAGIGFGRFIPIGSRGRDTERQAPTSWPRGSAPRPSTASPLKPATQNRGAKPRMVEMRPSGGRLRSRIGP